MEPLRGFHVKRTGCHRDVNALGGSFAGHKHSNETFSPRTAHLSRRRHPKTPGISKLIGRPRGEPETPVRNPCGHECYGLLSRPLGIINSTKRSRSSTEPASTMMRPLRRPNSTFTFVSS